MELFIIGGILLAGILAFCAAGVIQEELGLRSIRAQLRAPLLHDDGTDTTDAIERRVEIAVREARAGFRLCPQCEFSNPRRAIACVICSAPVASSRTQPSVATTTATLTARQQRVRKRKSWQRRVNDDGKVVWHRNDPSTAPLSTSFVLQTKSVSAASETCAPETAEEEHITVVVPAETTAQVAATLERERRDTLVAIVNVEDADAAEPAFANRAGNASVQEMKDTVANATLDFPTKLAQFITASSVIFLNASTQEDGETSTVSRFRVQRATLLADSVDAIATMTPTQARAAIRVDFVGEQGIDAGGVYREWFLLATERVIQPDAGIFMCVNHSDQTFYLNHHSEHVLGEHHLVHFLVAGRLLGRALLEGNVTGFHIALPLLKIILGLPVSFEDLEHFDPEVYKSLRWLLENEGVESLGLDFTATEKLPDNSTRTVELVRQGAEISVTDDNKHDYVLRQLKYLLFERVSSQLFAFLKGLYEVVPVELLMLFDAEELDYVLAGSDEIDVDDWERNTITSKSLVDHPALAAFWSSTRALSNAERQRLLQFATGATRVPPGGFSALTSYDGRLCRFTLKGIDPMRTRGYIRSHACFNRLDLPLHLEPKDMKLAISAALSNRTLGFTTA